MNELDSRYRSGLFLNRKSISFEALRFVGKAGDIANHQKEDGGLNFYSGIGDEVIKEFETSRNDINTHYGSNELIH